MEIDAAAERQNPRPSREPDVTVKEGSDLLNTGIDIPELLNLVFFKHVRKWWGGEPSSRPMSLELVRTRSFYIFDAGTLSFWAESRDH